MEFINVVPKGLLDVYTVLYRVRDGVNRVTIRLASF